MKLTIATLISFVAMCLLWCIRFFFHATRWLTPFTHSPPSFWAEEDIFERGSMATCDPEQLDAVFYELRLPPAVERAIFGIAAVSFPTSIPTPTLVRGASESGLCLLAVKIVALFSVASAAKPGAGVSGTLGLCTGPGVDVGCTDFALGL
ncbi:hypothetical protein B0H13DRAFT_1899623 [Mycena leptocephala]|nr:hypothetical protein B0H13DRAFT_1899623 [Mycena leptocephala]